MHLGPGTVELIAFCPVWALPKVKQIPTFTTRLKPGNPVMLLLYVDDLFVTGLDWLISDTKRKLDSEFEMKDLCMMHYFLGMEVWQNAYGISLGKGKYTVEILKRFKMMDCKAMNTPMALNLKLLSDASSDSVASYDVPSDDWVLDVPDEHETKNLLFYEHLDPVLGRYEKCSLDYCKAYSEVPKGYS